MNRPSTSSDGPRHSGKPLRTAGALSIVAGVAWLLWLVALGVACELRGAASGGTADLMALAPPLAPCAAGVALWRRSPIAVLLLPAPVALMALLWVARLASPSVFELAACSLEGAGFITALAGLVVPFCGVLALLTYEPAVAQRGTDLLADACVRAYRSKLVRAVCAVALVAAVAAILHELLRPMALDVQALEYASPESTRYPLPTVPIVIEYPPQDEPQRERPSLPELDAHARFWITRIQLSAVPGRGLQRVGRALDERIGPVKWTSSPSFTPRLVTATGHFPPTVYQPRYRERLQAFEACKDEVRSDERFIEEWSTSVAGLLTPAEISWTQSVFRQGGFAILRRYERKPVDFCVLENVEEVRKLQELRASREKCLLLPAWKRGTADLLEPGEWQTLAGLLGRQEFAVLLRTCDALFMNNLRRSDAPDAPAWARAPVYAKCNDPNPGSEEEFSRVVLQWQCERSRCRWSSIDMAAWQRISSVPCRTTGTSACLEEAFEYLASGRRGSRQ